ncbi:uncharacterized protein LOC111614453 [Centruroides sculpturatus]|uniref:uncharacterized protein LOC111614453 n=1 Tax=Centruroides sculpturatus TaxID=218467 RepID=UPI000C6E1606|nr:uncharacterized protein LOC111614453 [Centruroides sculpturatus]
MKVFKKEEFESFFDNVKQQLTSKEDALVLIIHYFIISKGVHFVGIGEDWSTTSSKIENYKLPENWNSNQNQYTFRYTNDNDYRFLLQVMKSENFEYLYIYWISPDAPISWSTFLMVDDYIEENWETFSSTYKGDLDNLATILERTITINIPETPEISANVAKVTKEVPFKAEEIKNERPLLFTKMMDTQEIIEKPQLERSSAMKQSEIVLSKTETKTPVKNSFKSGLQCTQGSSKTKPKESQNIKSEAGAKETIKRRKKVTN